MKTIIIFSILISACVFSQNRDFNDDIKAEPGMNIFFSPDSVNKSMTMNNSHYKVSNAWQTNFNMRNYPKSSMECSVTLGSWKVNNAIMTLVNDTTVCVITKSKKTKFNGLDFYVYEDSKNFFRNIDDINYLKTGNMSKSTGGVYGALCGIIVGELIGLAIRKDNTDSVTVGLGGIIGGLLGYVTGSQLTSGEKIYDFKNLPREKKLKKLRAILKENYEDF